MLPIFLGSRIRTDGRFAEVVNCGFRFFRCVCKIKGLRFFRNLFFYIRGEAVMVERLPVVAS